MAKQDPGHASLIQQTLELTAMSRNFCDNARRAKQQSERLVQQAARNVAFGRSRRRSQYRKRLLAN